MEPMDHVIICTRSEVGELPPDLSGTGTEPDRMIKPRVQNEASFGMNW